MEAIYAGLAAWTVEIIIACIMLIGLKNHLTLTTYQEKKY